MGNYGFYPHQGDGSWDLLASVEDAGMVAVRALMARQPKTTHDLWSRLGALMRVTDDYFWHLPMDMTIMALHDLLRCKADEAFMTAWRNPKRAMAVVHKLETKLRGNLIDAFANMPPRQWKGHTFMRPFRSNFGMPATAAAGKRAEQELGKRLAVLGPILPIRPTRKTRKPRKVDQRYEDDMSVTRWAEKRRARGRRS